MLKLIMQSFGHKCKFCHNLYYASNQKSSLTKVLKCTNLNEDMVKKLKSCSHNLNKASNQKSSSTKVLRLTNLNEYMNEKVKSWGEKSKVCSHWSQMFISS